LFKVEIETTFGFILMHVVITRAYAWGEEDFGAWCRAEKACNFTLYRSCIL